MATDRTTSTQTARRVLCAGAALAAALITLTTAYAASASTGALPSPGPARDLGSGARCGGFTPATSSSTLAARRTASAGPRSYGWPLEPFNRQHPVRGFFNDPRDGKRSSAFHFGIDIAGPDGTPVYAVAAGTAYLRSARAVAIKEPSGRVLSYWHIVPVVRKHQAVAKHQLLGHIGTGWGHVHFAESRQGTYVNPLRSGALTPYRDHTAPTVAALQIKSSELVVDAFDTTPVAVPKPWNDLPVTPVLVRWRVVGASGEAVIPWRTGLDFRHRMLDASTFWNVYARGTHKNAPGDAGRYCFRIIGWDSSRLGGGSHRIQVAASDTAGNRTVATFPVDVR